MLVAFLEGGPSKAFVRALDYAVERRAVKAQVLRDKVATREKAIEQSAHLCATHGKAHQLEQRSLDFLAAPVNRGYALSFECVCWRTDIPASLAYRYSGKREFPMHRREGSRPWVGMLSM